MLHEFKSFTKERLDLDQLVALAAFGRKLREEYEFHQLDEPEWVGDQLKILRREITTRNAEKLESRKREIEARLEAMKTPTQRKTELLKEKAKIDKQLEEVGG